MPEHETLVFLLSLAVLLSAARVLGELARRLGFPLVFGELASGIVLGPTVFGRVAPGAQHWLFPGGTAAQMLAGYTNVAVVLLLVVAGLEVNLGVVRRRGRSALLTSIMGIAMPLAGGFLLGILLPDADLVPAVGFGLNARGAMEIVLALLALEAGLLKVQVFVALVIMALLTSLVSGPTMKWILRGVDEEALSALLARGAWVRELVASTPKAAIEELVGALAGPLADLTDHAARCVLEREAIAPTGLGDEGAIPHAAVPGLGRPVLALGTSRAGIDFNAPDGRPAKLVFLLLMPPRAHDQEVRILAQIARAAIEPSARAKLLDATSLHELIARISEVSLAADSRPASRASLADI